MTIFGPRNFRERIIYWIEARRVDLECWWFRVWGKR
jgi:hypothetical protein